ncbi:MAG: hypothetical protein H6742_15090 [Alphaproteobacteria bacterium]|nr:hypothetical protein [Alphaproteobacteria bacterium]
MPSSPRPPGYIDFVDGQAHYWRNETLWAAVAGLPAQDVALDALPWRDDGCHVLGDPPKWGALADHCKRVLAVDPRFPVIVGPTGDIVDGMHRIIRAFVEDRATVACVRLPRMPPPDETWTP